MERTSKNALDNIMAIREMQNNTPKNRRPFML